MKVQIAGDLIEDRPEMVSRAPQGRQGLKSLLDLLENAARREDIKAVILIVRTAPAWHQIEEIQSSLLNLRSRGVRCLAHLEQGTHMSYYLAGVCDKILMPPFASLELVGLRAEDRFVSELLEDLGIEAEVFPVGRYKSAAERFVRSDLSEANKEMLESLLRDMQSRLCARVSETRNLSRDEVEGLLQGGPYTAKQALETGLIDGIAYEDELETALTEESPPMKEIPRRKLHPRDPWIWRLLTFWRPQVAYLQLEGLITTGSSRRGFGSLSAFGSDTFRELLERAASSRRIRSVVLRINSPGGSALASDLMWHEVRKLDCRKPVVASLGGIAASGGYFVASAARRVYAMPSSLTGSIGVLGGKLNFSRLLERWKVRTDAVELGTRSGYSSLSRPYTPEETEIVRSELLHVYEQFIERVSEGRKRTRDEIREVAEGRVWTGQQAQESGLVDEIGGLREAVSTAVRAGGLAEGRKYRVVSLLPRGGWRDWLPARGWLSRSPERLILALASRIPRIF